MFTSATTTLSRYNLRRIGQIALVLLLVAAAGPAVALFNQDDGNSQVMVVTATSPTAQHAGDTPGLASAATAAGFDDELPTDKHLPQLKVTAALVQELGAASPLFVYRSNARWPLASVTKLMTAVVALDALGAGTIVTVSQEAVDTEGEAGNFKVGDKYTVIDLVRAMLTVSSNDAAIALANAYDKKQLGEAYDQALNKTALFTAAMQDKARFIGMPSTYFGDPSGLSVVNQSVVSDLNVLINYIAVNHPELLDITRNRTNVRKERRTMTNHTDVNINEFAGQSDFMGGKTGRIDQSEGNLLSVFKHNGKKYLIIVLGTADRFGETRALYEWTKQTVGAQDL